MSATSRICPICSKPVEGAGVAARFLPFCSRRCSDLDLGRWLKGSYAIAGQPGESDSQPPSQTPVQPPEDE